VNFDERQRRNRRCTALLIVGFVLLFAGFGAALDAGIGGFGTGDAALPSPPRTTQPPMKRPACARCCDRQHRGSSWGFSCARCSECELAHVGHGLFAQQ
jgi:hypothetical protein